MILTNAGFLFNSYDASAKVRSVDVPIERIQVDDTKMGTTNTKSTAAGLKSWEMTVEFEQDFADNALDEQLFTAWDAGAAIAVILKTANAAASATNPWYQGNAILVGYSPVKGKVGDLATVTARFVSAGALSRTVA